MGLKNEGSPEGLRAVDHLGRLVLVLSAVLLALEYGKSRNPIHVFSESARKIAAESLFNRSNLDKLKPRVPVD